MPRLIGLPLPRKEDRRLLTGAGRFTDDLNIPGQTYAAFVRSPHAHARVQGIDSSAALALPGVIAVLTAADYAADGCGPIAHMPDRLLAAESFLAAGKELERMGRIEETATLYREIVADYPFSSAAREASQWLAKPAAASAKSTQGK